MSNEGRESHGGRQNEARHGLDALREAIAEKLLDDADEVAEAMIVKSKEGSVPAFRAVLEVAGEDKAMREAIEHAVHPRRSLATEWANEPEWTGDDASGMAWWASKQPK